MLQAVIVVGLVLGRAVVRDMYDTSQAASQIGYVTMGMALVPMVGPALGGVVDESFGWRMNFWLLIVLAGGVFALIWADLGETAPRTGRRLAEQFREYPELLASRRFWGYCATTAFSSGTFFAYLGGAPFVGSEVFHLSASELGLYFGAPALGYFFGNGLSGRYSQHFGINKMILWGCLVTAGGLCLAAVVFAAGFGSALMFFGFTTFVGLGNGLVLPNAISGTLSVRPHLAGTASGLGGAMMLGGGATLSALAGALLTPQTGAQVLLVVMSASSLAALVAILLTIRREAQLQA